jgi:hypothetical protein
MTSSEEVFTDKTHWPIDELMLSIRAEKCLRSIKVNYIGDLILKTEQELMSIRNFGRKCLREVEDSLKQIDLRLGTAALNYQTSSVKHPIEVLKRDPQETFLSEWAGLEKKTFLHLFRKVEELDLSPRTANCLKVKGINLIGELVQKKPSELLSITNFGKKCLAEVRLKLNKMNLDVGVEIPGWNGENVKKVLSNYSLDIDRLRRSEAKKRYLIKSGTLEGDLGRLAELAVSERNRNIVIKYLGWDGKGRRTLQVLGKEFGMTRERVRQVFSDFEHKVSEVRRLKGIYLPKITLALNKVAEQIPGVAGDIEYELARQGVTKEPFRLEGLLTAANILGRKALFIVAKFRNQRFALRQGVENCPKTILHLSRKAIAHRGVATISDIVAQVEEDIHQHVPESLAVSVLSTLKDFRWLDESPGWFFLSSVPRNRLLNLIEKILSICDQIDIGDLRSGISRYQRMEGFAPPKEVLLQFCREISWCKIQGGSVYADPRLDWERVLKGSADWAMCAILKEYGPAMPTAEFERRCLEIGLNKHTFSLYLSYSPIISKIVPGVYALRGSKVPPGIVESLKSDHRPQKVITDYGWTSDGEIWVAIKLSEAILRSGVFSIPSGMKKFIQGEFALKAADGAAVTALKIKDCSGWNLSSFFTRRGGEVGDYLVLLFDLKDREVRIQLGDISLLDDLMPQEIGAD